MTLFVRVAAANIQRVLMVTLTTIDGGAADPEEGHIVHNLWRQKLISSGRGDPKALFFNAVLALRESQPWFGILQFDEFAQQTIISGRTPWREAHTQPIWQPADDLKVTEWLQQQGIEVGIDVASKAVELVASERAVHPVREYLSGLIWDGINRIDHVPELYLGVNPTENQPYVRTVFTRWCISAIARIFSPGCQADHCLVLEGEQGKLKSTFFKVLGGDWFTDSLADLQSKDAALGTAGVWVIEVAELDSFRKSEITLVKAFLSRRDERIRLPYGRRTVKWPRQCVFAGTTNKNDWSTDETGARRFWPLTITKIDIGAITELRNQIWAEARDRYLAKEPWWLDTEELISTAASEQDARYTGDPWDQKVADHVAAKAARAIEGTTISETVTTADILANVIGMPDKDQTRADQMRVGNILRMLGWRRLQKNTIGSRQRYYTYDGRLWRSHTPKTGDGDLF